jgi:hypothetical protein
LLIGDWGIVRRFCGRLAIEYWSSLNFTFHEETGQRGTELLGNFILRFCDAFFLGIMLFSGGQICPSRDFGFWIADCGLRIEIF